MLIRCIFFLTAATAGVDRKPQILGFLIKLYLHRSPLIPIALTGPHWLPGILTPGG